MAEVCKALYAYNGVGGEKITTLQFEAGEVIKVIFSGNTGWWEGEKDGARGWFPASYVTKIQDDDVQSNYSDDWREVSTEDGEIYYVNISTNETSWEIPKPVEAKASRRIENSIIRSASFSTNNTNGNSVHLSLPLSRTTEAIKNSTQSDSIIEKDPDSPTADTISLPMNAQTTYTSSLQRSKTFSSPPAMHLVTTRPSSKVVNGVSFPGEEEPNDQDLLQPGRFSYCDYFWSDKIESQNTYQTGFGLLYHKLLKGKQMCKEMAEFFKAREAIESQYAKSLAALANSVHASSEEGTLGEAWRQVKSTTLLESKIHEDFAKKVKLDVSQSFLEERERERKDMKKMDAHISDLRKQVQVRYQATEKIKQQLLDKTKDYENKMSSMKHTKEDVQKARRKSTRHAEDLTRSIELYNKQRQGWFEETVTSSLVLERHEAERVENLKALLEKYSKLLSDSSQGCSDSCDIINEHTKLIDADKDRERWVTRHSTGSIRPVDLVL